MLNVVVRGMNMKQWLARTIVRLRAVIMVAILAIAVWSATNVGATTINYDLTKYLSADTMTQRALTVMRDEFGSNETLRLMFVDLEEGEVDAIVDELNELPEIFLASHDPQEGVREQDGKTYCLVSLTLADCDPTELVRKLQVMFPQVDEYYVGGTAATQIDVQTAVGEEMPLVMLISMVVVLAVLLLTSHAWLEPIVILAVLGISIVINMGTNFVFESVSFVTFAVGAVLQLALSIDYAIMLLHAYNGLCDEGLDAERAMEGALVQSFMRIASSAVTTVAGLLSLLFMSFTIGFDIGLVLSKGILISMLCVFLLMPGFALLLRRPLQLTRHTQLRLGGAQLAGFIGRAKVPVAVVMGCAVLAGAILQSQNTYSFTNSSAAEKSGTVAINAVFGESRPLALLVPGGQESPDYGRQRQLVDALEGLRMADGSPSVTKITSMVTTGEAAIKSYTAEDVAELTGMNLARVKLFFAMKGLGETVSADELLEAADGFAGAGDTVEELRQSLDAARTAFVGLHYDRMILDVGFDTTDERFMTYMDGILAAIESVYGQDYFATGTPMSNYDISEAFQSDLLKVNVITLAAILLVVVIAFRSLRLPLLLVFVIEGAIWINMGISCLAGEPVFFISYLICVSIQMGATIDYGILLSDQYRTLRRELPQGEALRRCLERSMPAILTSGTILVTAGYIVGRICSIYYIYSIGLLISRGALISVVLVLTLLPALLLIGDRLVVPDGRRGQEIAGPC